MSTNSWGGTNEIIYREKKDMSSSLRLQVNGTITHPRKEGEYSLEEGKRMYEREAV